ncbi:Protein SET [Monoraphidium neglectum]|uniref:Protein SET n=1 Tax=Monoraphidium neglectum TaxID=145388 RepID=A0A0D2JUY8_9CHLO|nr:Protein SET [Monoraphidium neglectum]KIZ02633.1 Protein SET [Monoraphidium neglectum]|eukprot:XP_013901652.1 Protein SET [Monoraphidium neglectum]
MDGGPEQKKLRLDEEFAGDEGEEMEGGDEGEEADGEELDEDWAPDEETRALLNEAGQAQTELNKAGGGLGPWPAPPAATPLAIINDAASEEVLQVEQRFNVKRKPVYRQRGDALARIPAFWRRALMGHPSLQEFITEDDLGALGALERVDVVDNDDIKSGFTVSFTFNTDTNTYFSNAVLEKSLAFGEDASLEAKATPIQWKEGMEPAQADERPGTKRSRVPDYNFFTSWFLSEKYAPGTQDAVAEYIKEDVWPDPVKYWRVGLIQELPTEAYALPADDEDGEGEEGEEEYDEGEEGDPNGGGAYGDGGFGAALADEDEGEEGDDDQGS